MTPVSLVRLCDVMQQRWLIQQCFVCLVSVKCIIHLLICFKTDSKCSIRHVYMLLITHVCQQTKNQILIPKHVILLLYTGTSVDLLEEAIAMSYLLHCGGVEFRVAGRVPSKFF